jgi:RimJ/RimL family protein N-acetyltransferase
MSAESRRRRFLSPKPKLTARDLRFLTEVDQHDHVAIVAVGPAGDIVAVGRYNAWAGRPGRAELALAVVDSLHGRGLGTTLGRRLVDHARVKAGWDPGNVFRATGNVRPAD